MKQFLAIVLVVMMVTVSISGCTSIKDDRKRTQTEGAAVGAGVGAVVGSVIGYAIGGKRGALAGAAIGAGAGGVAGYAYGTHVADEKEKYAKEEDWLDDCIASAEKVNEDTRQYNNQLAGEIEVLDVETKKLQQDYTQKKVKRAALVQEKKTVDASLVNAQEKLKRARFELENQEQVLADARTNNQSEYEIKLSVEIEKLKGHIAELEAHTEALASMSQRMSV